MLKKKQPVGASLADGRLTKSRTPPQTRLRVVAVLCSVGFLPWLVSSANSTNSHAAAKMASSPCSCQNAMSNERSGKLPSTSRVFQTEFRGMIMFSPLNRSLSRWFHVIKGISWSPTDEERE